MPTQKTVQRARQKKREGKKPSTQAGEFVKEEMRRYERGEHLTFGDDTVDARGLPMRVVC